MLPYFARPYQYVSPYVRRADTLGDATLSRVDERLPALKKPTGELVADGKSLVALPYRKAFETRDHVLAVYGAEVKHVAGGDAGADGGGLVTRGKAAVSTGLVIASESLNWVRGLLRSAKVHAKEAEAHAADRLRSAAHNNANNST